MKNLIIITILCLSALTVKAKKKEKTYKVLAACGQCQFGMNDSEGCDLAVQVAGKYYWVNGSSLHDHGDEHDPEGGMCKTKRKAKVVGRLKNDTIYSSEFILIK